jgi:hypothetical protein
MSTPPIPVVTSQSKLQTILAIINATLQGLTLVPVIGTGAQLGLVFETILQHALAAYQAEAGQPIDLTKIPIETPVP